MRQVVSSGQVSATPTFAVVNLSHSYWTSKLWTSSGMQIQRQIKLRVELLDVFSVAHNRDHGSAVTSRRLDHVTTSVKLPYRISVADCYRNKLLNARLEAAVSRCLGTRTKSGERKNLRATLHIIPTFFYFCNINDNALWPAVPVLGR